MTISKPLIDNENIQHFLKRYDLIRTSATGGFNSTVQGMAYDSKNEKVYTISGGGTDGRGHSLNIFNSTTLGELSIYTRNRSIYFGHQGIGLMHDQSDNGNIIVWLSRNYNSTPNTGHLVTSFNGILSTDTDSITNNIIEWQVFPTTTSAQSTSPCISICERYLIAKSNTDSTATIRVFDVQSMWKNRQIKTNYSTDYLYQFTYQRPYVTDGVNYATNLQHIASDGAYIYILENRNGFTNTDISWVYVFTIDGNFLYRINISKIGYEDAVAESPNPTVPDGIKEYESLTIFQDGSSLSLGIGLSTSWVAAGSSAKHFFIYEIGKSSTIVGLSGGNISVSKGIHSASSYGADYKFGVSYPQKCWTIATSGVLYSDVAYDLGSSTKPVANIYTNGNISIVKSSGAPWVYCDTGSANNSGFRTKNSLREGYFYISSAGNLGVYDTTGSTWVLRSSTARDTYVLGTNINLMAPIKVSGEIIPNTSATYALGSSILQWTTAYLSSGSITTSDRNYKNNICQLTENELKVAKACASLYRTFQIKNGASGRTHIGVIAQEVAEIFISNGLNPEQYGLYCYDSWNAQSEIKEIDEDGETIITSPAIEAGERYAVRYDELNSFINAGLAVLIDEMNRRLEALERRSN